MIGRKYTHGREDERLIEIEPHRKEFEGKIMINRDDVEKCFTLGRRLPLIFTLDALKVVQPLSLEPMTRQASSNIAHSIQAILELPYDDIPVLLVQIVRRFIALHCIALMIAIEMGDQGFKLDRIV